MTSASTVTIIKMLETLPEPLQDRVVEHLRDYIEDLQDEARWNESFSRTEKNLASAARRARKAITQGKATPLDLDKL